MGATPLRDFVRFLQIAMGSASEVEYELLLARDLGYLGESDYAALDAQTTEVKRMLGAYIRRTQRSLDSSTKRPGRVIGQTPNPDLKSDF